MTKLTREEAFRKWAGVDTHSKGNVSTKWTANGIFDLLADCEVFREDGTRVVVKSGFFDSRWRAINDEIARIPAVAKVLKEGNVGIVGAVEELATELAAITDAAPRAGRSSVETVPESIARRVEDSDKQAAASDSVLKGINDAADEHGRRGESVIDFIGRLAAELGVAEGNLEIAHAKLKRGGEEPKSDYCFAVEFPGAEAALRKMSKEWDAHAGRLQRTIDDVRETLDCSPGTSLTDRAMEIARSRESRRTERCRIEAAAHDAGRQDDESIEYLIARLASSGGGS